MKKCEVDLKKGGCRRKTEKPGIFAMIVKISLGLQNIRNHSENFASLAKFSLYENFDTLAKFSLC